MSQMSALLDENEQNEITGDPEVGHMLAVAFPDMNFANLNSNYADNLPMGHNEAYEVIDRPIEPHQFERASLPLMMANNTQFVIKEEFHGVYNFEVFIDPHHGNKSPWVYSSALKKVFILIDTYFPVEFKIEMPDGEAGPPSDLFVRVTPCYSHAQYSHELVSRCIQHIQQNEPTNANVPQNVWPHIIRCQNNNASYDGGKAVGRHLSVLVPLYQPQRGMDTVRSMYKFVCKNSCTSGMNRRAVDIVFTLEDIDGNVLGRTTMSVRICSCPKRDKEKEEREHTTKGVPMGSSKKRKMDKKPASFNAPSQELKEYEITLKIPGKHNVQAIYKYAHDLMAGEMVRHNTEQPFKKTMSDISAKTKNID